MTAATQTVTPHATAPLGARLSDIALHGVQNTLAGAAVRQQQVEEEVQRRIGAYQAEVGAWWRDRQTYDAEVQRRTESQLAQYQQALGERDVQIAERDARDAALRVQAVSTRQMAKDELQHALIVITLCAASAAAVMWWWLGGAK